MTAVSFSVSWQIPELDNQSYYEELFEYDSLFSFMRTGTFTGEREKYSLSIMEQKIQTQELQQTAVEELEGRDSYGHSIPGSHEFIQAYFPTCESSKAQPRAPYFTPTHVAVFKSLNASQRECIQKNIQRAFGIMLFFYGFEYREGQQPLMTKGESDFSKKRFTAGWAHDHNNARITRILHSLNLFGLRKEAEGFYDHLQTLEGGLAPNLFTQAQWEQAMTVQPLVPSS